MSKETATAKPAENGTPKGKEIKMPLPIPKTYFINLITEEGGIKRLHVSEEIMNFINMVASTELDQNFDKVYKLNNLVFHVQENVPEAPVVPAQKP